MGALDDRVVLVTGAGRGLGRGVAVACAAAGATVVVGVRSQPQGDDVVAHITGMGGSAETRTWDVTDPEANYAALAHAADRHGGVDAVIHNAVSVQAGRPEALESVDWEVWNDHASISVTAAFHIAKASFPYLKERHGSLLFMTSPAGIDGSDLLSVYATTKGVQRAMVKSLAREWGPDDVRVNSIAPLAFTPAMENAVVVDPTLEPRLRRIIPLGRIGDSEHDIGPTAVFMCSDAAHYVTGQTLPVGGGRFTGL